MKVMEARVANLERLGAEDFHGRRASRVWKIFGRSRKQFPDRPVPCERCDEPAVSRFNGERGPFYWWPEEIAHIIIPPEGHEYVFSELYPRPLDLCQYCLVAHHCWLNRRRFYLEYERGHEILADAHRAGVVEAMKPLQLVATPVVIGTPAEHLAVAEVASWSFDIGARVITRKALEEQGQQLRVLSSWIERWHEDHPWNAGA